MRAEALVVAVAVAEEDPLVEPYRVVAAGVAASCTLAVVAWVRSYFVQVREEDSSNSAVERMVDSILPGYTRGEAETLAHGWLARVYQTEACLLV